VRYILTEPWFGCRFQLPSDKTWAFLFILNFVPTAEPELMYPGTLHKTQQDIVTLVSL